MKRGFPPQKEQEPRMREKAFASLEQKVKISRPKECRESCLAPRGHPDTGFRCFLCRSTEEAHVKTSLRNSVIRALYRVFIADMLMN